MIEICWNNNHLGVWFFDNLRRRILNYAFTKADADRLFLYDLTRWEYPNDRARLLNEATVVDTFAYEPDGTAKRIIKDNFAAETITQERTGVDVEQHWEPVPTFGDWGFVTRWERDKPAVAQDPRGPRQREHHADEG